jgi:hypothetical protein
MKAHQEQRFADALDELAKAHALDLSRIREPVCR